MTLGRQHQPARNSTARRQIERRLRAAVGTPALRVHYQTVVDLPSGRPTGVEALARWDDGVLGSVPPQVFIHAAEQSDLIHALGRWVLSESCRQAASWQPAEGTGPSVAVNVSVVQLAEESFVREVQTALDSSGLPPGRLCLEVTETAAIADLDEAAARLGALRDLGLSLALDDFGTGFSSLTLLRRLPVQLVKIDRSFIEHVASDTRDAVMVRLVIDAAHSLGMQVCAEGVETAGQAGQLVAMGCDSAQGWLFSRARAASAVLEEQLRNRGSVAEMDLGNAGTGALPLGGSDELVVVTNPDGRISYVSSASRTILGWMPAELSGTPAASHLHPEDLEELTGEGGRWLPEGVSTHRVRHRDGSWRWFSSTTHLVRDPGGAVREMMCVSRDVSAAVRAERALAESEVRFRHAFDDAPIGMALTTLSGTFLRVNAAFASMLGTTCEALKDANVEELTHPDDRAADRANLEALLAGRETTQDVHKRYLDPNGNPVPARVRAALVRDKDDAPAWVAAHITGPVRGDTG